MSLQPRSADGGKGETIARNNNNFNSLCPCDRHEFFQNFRDDKMNNSTCFGYLAIQIDQDKNI
jgi:hypothetical protein